MNADQPLRTPLRIIVMAGGTGGHVFPALAVADELRSRGVEVTWLGTRRGLEAEVAPRAGFPIDYIQVAGLRGKGGLSLLTAPVKLLVALMQGLSVMRRRHPSAVLGMGGYVAGPGGLAAWLMRCPLLIHEQNARPGYTNRLLAPLARRVMEAFPNTFAGRKNVLHTGNPLRADFQQLADNDSSAEEDIAEKKMPLKLLVVGGSLGAARLNEVVPQALTTIDINVRPEVWHQAGKRNIETALKAYDVVGVDARVEAFIDDMAAAYAWADVVLCRAGAMTVAEIAATAAPSILVPYPHAVDDHQTANARYLSENHAAILLQQTQLSAERLAEILTGFTPAVLKKMAEAARQLALLDATARVADQCLAIAQGEANG